MTMRSPNFNNLLKVLARERPERPTLFEFFLNGPLYMTLAEIESGSDLSGLNWHKMVVKAFARAGYDYATVPASDFGFPVAPHASAKSRSMSDLAIITDRQGLAAYSWPNPDDFDYTRLDVLSQEMPGGMKLIVYGPGGVLENVMSLMGYEPMCFALADDSGLVGEVFDEVGSRLLRYYELTAGHEGVGALISNDDWGFNSQTMLPPQLMRKYVFPWHKKIVETIHRAGKPAILHSCGNLESVMDDIIDDMGYDGKHSYEDKILPVEDAYERWGNRIAVLGGIDVDFVCRLSPDEVYQRSKAMISRSMDRGGYALGTGNSVPEYVPREGYFAMIKAAIE